MKFARTVWQAKSKLSYWPMQNLDEKLASFQRIGLTQLPTPLDPLERLTAFLDGPKLWVKREDMTGFGFGGNKLRKLDYLLHSALHEGIDILVSGGVVQSNAQRQVAAVAARLGLECHLAVYHGRVSQPAPEYEHSGNVLLNRLFGAHLHDVAWDGDRNGAIQELTEKLKEEGKRPFMVPYGASCPLGAVGYASAIAELVHQCKERDIVPAAIVHCSGSAATQAGLIIGASIAMPETQIVGIDIDAEPERVRSDVIRYAEGAAELLDSELSVDAVEVVAGHAGPAYGVAHEATLEAIKLAGSLEAMVLDPVYSGMGLAGLIALIRAGRWSNNDDVVFIHTGGAPALFAYANSLGIG